MKRILFLILLSSMAFGQGAFIPPQQALKTVNGITAPAPLATVTVCAAGASGIPCTPALVGAIFKDAALTQPLSNPFTADANGNYQFAIAPGTYTVTTTASGFVGNSFQITVALATGGVATPGGSNSQLQFNNSGVLGGLANVAAGSWFASNGATNPPITQLKWTTDVRDKGIDCTGAADSTTAFQNMINAAPDYSSFTIPQGCKILVSGTPAITINQRYGLQFVGQGRSANSCDNQSGVQSQFIYNQAFASGNTVFNINQSQRLLFQNFTIVAQGKADIVWNVDQTTSPPITTANVWQDICVINNAPKSSTFKGWRFSNVASSNVEAQRLIRPFVLCSSNGPGSASDSGFGIWFNISNANLKDEVIDEPGFIGCSIGINITGSATGINNGLDSSSWTNIQLGGFNDALYGFRSEFSHGAVVQETNTVGPHLIMHNDFAALTGSVAVDCPTGCGNTTVINNETDSTPSDWFNNHGTSNGVLFAANNRFFSVDPFDFSQSFIIPPVAIVNHGSSYGGVVSTTDILMTPDTSPANCGLACASPPFIAEGNFSTNTTETFFYQVSIDHLSGAFNNSTLHIVHLPTSTLTPWIALQGKQSGLTVDQVPAQTDLIISTRGTPGGTTYSYVVVGHGSTGTSTASNTATIATGNATLSTTNFNFLQVPPAPGCTFFDVYRTAGGGSTGKIGTLSCVIATSTVPGELAFSDTGLTGDATSPPGSNTTGQIISLVPTGLAPLSITSTTPVSNLTTVPATYNHSGTQAANAHVVIDTCTLGTSCAVTLTGSAVFTSSSSYQCAVTDQTSAAAAKFAPSSGSAFTLTGTATDVLGYVCIGN